MRPFDFKVNEIEPYTSSPQEKDVFTKAELSEIFRVSDTTIFEFLFLTGMRSGACIALEWKDVDWEMRKIRVRAEICKTKKRGERSVDLCERAHEILVEERHKRIGKMKFIFTSRRFHDRFKTQGSLSLKFRRLLDSINIEKPERFSLHALRHSFISWAIEDGVPVTQVADWVGDSVETISNVYAHAIKDRGREHIKFLDKYRFNQE